MHGGKQSPARPKEPAGLLLSNFIERQYIAKIFHDLFVGERRLPDETVSKIKKHPEFAVIDWFTTLKAENALENRLHGRPFETTSVPKLLVRSKTEISPRCLRQFRIGRLLASKS